MYSVIPENFFMPMAAPGRRVYWDCIYRLFSIMDKQLSFGVECNILVDELQYYFEQTQALRWKYNTDCQLQINDLYV